MIYTSNYNYCNTKQYIPCSISGNKGKDANFNGKYYPLLAPKLKFWKIFHNNIGKINDMENYKFYIREYYNQVLSNLDPLETYNELDNNILMCYENNNEFCHRHIVAAWFELFLNIHIPEIIINNEIIEVSRPSYIKEYLELYIKQALNTDSIKEYYLNNTNNKVKKLVN